MVLKPAVNISIEKACFLGEAHLRYYVSIYKKLNSSQFDSDKMIEFLKLSGVDKEHLKDICSLISTNKKPENNLLNFIISMHLTLLAKHGHKVPTKLPFNLQRSYLLNLINDILNKNDKKSYSIPENSTYKKRHVKANSIDITSQNLINAQFSCFVPDISPNNIDSDVFICDKDTEIYLKNRENEDSEPLVSELSGSEEEIESNLLPYTLPTSDLFSIKYNILNKTNLNKELSIQEPKDLKTFMKKPNAKCENGHNLNVMPPQLPPRTKHGRSASLDLNKLFANAKIDLSNLPHLQPMQTTFLREFPIPTPINLQLNGNGCQELIQESNGDPSCSSVLVAKEGRSQSIGSVLSKTRLALIEEENAYLRQENHNLLQRIQDLECALIKSSSSLSKKT